MQRFLEFLILGFILIAVVWFLAAGVLDDLQETRQRRKTLKLRPVAAL